MVVRNFKGWSVRGVRLVTLCGLTLCAALNSRATAPTENRRDGNWWLLQDKVTKLDYVVGFFDGMDLGYEFSYFQFSHDPDKGACLISIRDSYGRYSAKYLDEVTNNQLADGLDAFYADYRNRRIRVSDAVWLVVNGIAGTPQKELDEMIEQSRKNAASR